MLRPMDYERKLVKQSLQEYYKKKIIKKKKLFCVTAKCGIVFDKRKGSSRDRI